MKSFYLFITILTFINNAFCKQQLPGIPPSLSSFPKDFYFGTSTSSYQVEGGWLDGGKGMSIWDGYSHTPGIMANGDTGDVANDMYHKYPEDIKLMKQQGLKNYRFSISWVRILPTGIAPINQEGVDYYNNLINMLLDNGIEPHVTLYHGEMPLALTSYPLLSQPFLDAVNFPIWFKDYSDVVFSLFGDRVKHWFTFNEPFCFSVYGVYGNKDPYNIAHNALIAHAESVELYRTKYVEQKGEIGIILNTAHFYPKDSSNPSDVAAAQRGYDFWFGWFLDPIKTGDYPASMRETVGDRLPKFTEEQKKLVMGSTDFIAINFYFPYITSAGTHSINDEDSFDKDMNVTNGFDPSWPLSETGWGIYAPGLTDLLMYTHETYNLPIYITENGLAWQEDNAAVAVNDKERQSYIYNHIEAVGQALIKGANIKGYFVWSFQDNLEWLSGYQMHFGLIYIERPSLKRIIKNSLRFYSTVLQAFENLNK